MPLRLTLSTIFLTLLLVLTGPLSAQSQPGPNWPVPAFTEVASGLTEVVDIQNAGDGSNRLFLVEKRGRVRILKNGALRGEPLLDLHGVAGGSEQGLLGLAFPPGFAQKMCFYVCYNRSADGAVVVSRFGMSPHDPDLAESWAEEVLLVTPKTRTNHNGGQLAFGQDGLLYISIGDGGGSGDPDRNSQNLTNRLGKILRIDVENTSPGLPYAIPSTNPFATSSTLSREILCWGLRNPWRFSFDPLNGDLFIGDVGEVQREEINHVPAAEISSGINFGWSVKEGTLDYVAQAGTVGALRPPAFEYGRPLGYSVTGGHIYRGSNPRLQGLYLFGDFATGRLWAMESPAAGGRAQVLRETNHSFSTFGKDEAGEIYFSDYFENKVYRIDATGDLPPPVISTPSGIFTDRVSFSIKTDVPGAAVRYTTDGTEPDENSPLFPEYTWITRTEPCTLKAASFREGYPRSPIVEVFYQFMTGDVIVPGSYFGIDYLTWYPYSATPGAEIRYTLDGSAPNENSLLYDPAVGIVMTKDKQQLKAVAMKREYGWVPGAIRSVTADLSVAATIMSTTYSYTFLDLYDPVHLANPTTNVILRYTTDGTTPTLQSPVWPGDMALPADTILKVLASKEGLPSGLMEFPIRRISVQNTRFEKLPGTLWDITDLLRMNDSVFYGFSQNSVWKLQGGTWARIHQGSASQTLMAIASAPDGKIAVAYKTNTGGGIRFFDTSGNPGADWNFSSLTPQDIVPLPEGGYLVADSATDKILIITGPGASSVAPAFDASGSPFVFSDPLGVALDVTGEISVAANDGRLHRIGSDGRVSTPSASMPGWTDGHLSAARFKNIEGIVIDRIGNLYLPDQNQLGTIRKIRPDMTVTSLRGPYTGAGSSGAITGSFGPMFPMDLDVDENGVLYIAGDNGIVCAIQEDWDNDGIPDPTETTIGAPFVVGIDDRGVDSDGDQISNSAEWIARTNPLISSSRPNGSVVEKLPDGAIALQFLSDPDKKHQLEYSDDLRFWRPMGSSSVSPLKSFSTTFPAPAQTTGRFYRLKSTP